MKQPGSEWWTYKTDNQLIGVAQDNSSAHEKLQLINRFESLWSRVAGIPIYLVSGARFNRIMNPPICTRTRLYLVQTADGNYTFICRDGLFFMMMSVVIPVYMCSADGAVHETYVVRNLYDRIRHLLLTCKVINYSRDMYKYYTKYDNESFYGTWIHRETIVCKTKKKLKQLKANLGKIGPWLRSACHSPLLIRYWRTLRSLLRL